MCIYRDFVKQCVFALLAVYFCFFVDMHLSVCIDIYLHIIYT